MITASNKLNLVLRDNGVLELPYSSTAHVFGAGKLLTPSSGARGRLLPLVMAAAVKSAVLVALVVATTTLFLQPFEACAENAEDPHISTRASGQEDKLHPKVYLYEHSALANRDIFECYALDHDIAAWLDERFDTAENMGEVSDHAP